MQKEQSSQSSTGVKGMGCKKKLFETKVDGEGNSSEADSISMVQENVDETKKDGVVARVGSTMKQRAEDEQETRRVISAPLFEVGSTKGKGSRKVNLKKLARTGKKCSGESWKH
ncbi:hypothetical protein M5689_010315 [Euphorbia peplus]|nr:hypothetical protein M5689_010315 [Euphorbia peplus]